LSQLTYIASNYPLQEVENPHCKSLSVNEALAMGIEVDDFLLRPGYNRDEPDVILWSDTEIVIDADGGGLDDDFSIFKLSDETEDVYTEKKYRAYVEWAICTKGRCQKLIDYIREQLTHTDEIELWNIWMGNGDRPHIKKRTISIDELTPDEVIDLEGKDVLSELPTQYCFVITR